MIGYRLSFLCQGPPVEIYPKTVPNSVISAVGSGSGPVWRICGNTWNQKCSVRKMHDGI